MLFDIIAVPVPSHPFADNVFIPVPAFIVITYEFTVYCAYKVSPPFG